MSEVTQEDVETWHRRFAALLFNRTWELIDKSNDRTSEDDQEMLAASFASRYHWGVVGGPEQFAVGDWLIGHVCSLLGLTDLAVRYARSCLDLTLEGGWGDYHLASAYEGMARAYAAAGDDGERDRYLALATEALDGIADPEDRAVIEGQIATVPR